MQSDSSQSTQQPNAPRDLVIATQNPGKVAELKRIFEELDLSPRFTIRPLTDFPPLHEPQEGSESFIENARIKARAYAAHTGQWCLADDSGLQVDALNNAPGVISSHYYSDGNDLGDPREIRDPANNQRLLKELDQTPFEARAARFVCVMCVADPAGSIIAESDGTFEGRIGFDHAHEHDGKQLPTVPRGTRGFGYDPLFLIPPAYDRAASELEPDEKNARSHRGAAARALAHKLPTSIT